MVDNPEAIKARVLSIVNAELEKLKSVTSKDEFMVLRKTFEGLVINTNKEGIENLRSLVYKYSEERHVNINTLIAALDTLKQAYQKYGVTDKLTENLKKIAEIIEGNDMKKRLQDYELVSLKTSYDNLVKNPTLFNFKSFQTVCLTLKSAMSNNDTKLLYHLVKDIAPFIIEKENLRKKAA